MKIKVIQAASEEPISIVDLKTKYLKDEFMDDTVAAGLIKAAREYCEDYQNKKYITQTLEVILDQFPNGPIELRDCSPIQSVTSIKYTDYLGNEKTLAPSNYIVDTDSFVNQIVPAYNKSWPSDTLQPVNAIRTRLIAGYGNASTVPQSVIWAMVLHIQSLYENLRPEERLRLEKARDALLGMRRVIPV